MAFLIGGANSAADTGFNIDNSCRFDGSNDYLTITFSSNPTSDQKGTVSYWTKRSGLGVAMFSGLVAVETGVSSYGTNWTSGDNLDATLYYPGSGDDYEGMLLTKAKYRDIGAWMHVVFAWDTTQSTNTNRFKLYINGVNQKDAGGYSTENYPDQNQAVHWGQTAAAHRIGANPETANNKWNGYMAEVVYTDGTQYAASDFGEFDEDSPTMWKPKNPSALTFGGNGFYLDFQDSSALGNDVSGNDNDFAATGVAAVDQCTDTPTNNFCTMNLLENYYQAQTFSQGNCIVTGGGSSDKYAPNLGTFGLSSGKWYYEVKCTDGGSDPVYYNVGYTAVAPRTSAAYELGHFATGYGYVADDGNCRTNDGDVSYGNLYQSDDIIGVYLDLDNNKLYFAQNGTIQASGTGISITDPASTPTGFYFPACTYWDTPQAAKFNFNFGGCPSFAISSGNADAKGYGNFEYDPSDGGSSSFDSAAKDFLAICTKNLATYG